MNGLDMSYKPAWRNGGGVVQDTVKTVNTSSADINPQTGKAWTWIDKILSATEKGVDIYGDIKNSPTGAEASATNGPTFLGMPRTVGIIITVVVGGLLAFGVYKLATK